MESSRAKIAGPVIAAGAVSLGLVLIGACGVGKHNTTYVAPPPIKSAAEADPPVREATGTTVPKVLIPPSPSWQVAPDGPRRQVGFTVPPLSTAGETSTRPGRTTTLNNSTTPLPLPPIVTTEPDEPATTTAEEPPTTTQRPTTTASPYHDGE
jgi:hypothetical protein